MRLEEIQALGRTLGLDDYVLNASKKTLIPAIQIAQGREPCFLMDKRVFCDERCEWRGECQKLTADWRR